MADKNPGTNFGGVELPGAPSEKELRWSLWWVENKEKLKRAAIALFVAFDIVLLGAGVWGFLDWLAFGGVDEERAVRQLASPAYGRFGGVGAVEELQLGAPIVLQAGSGKIDALVSVENRNRDYWAELTYQMIIGGTPTPERESFVLPGQAKYLAELGASSEGGGSVELRVLRRAWHRVDTQGAESVEAFLETRLTIEAASTSFTPADPLATTPVSSAKFILANRTAFSYYDVGLLVLLYRGDAIAAVNRIRIDRLQAGARRPFELFWYHSLPQVTKVEVIPDINVFDPGVYRPPL
jgi:hypothetical protein